MTTPLIKVNDVDVTDAVRWSDAIFISQVNGIAGQCQFAVRDLDHTRGFTFGQTITLDLDGDRRWSGFVQKSNRQYTAAVVDTTNPLTRERWFVITGFDVNILFTRRTVYDHDDPTKLTAMAPNPSFADSHHADQWAEDTPSDEIVKWVIENDTDMPGDGITTTGVDDLGSPVPDAAGAFAGGQTVGDFMRSVNRLLGGIWYLTPDYDLVHRFVETATTDYYLSDHRAAGGGGGGTTTTLNDLFARTVSNGWGTGPLGAWTDSAGASATSVAPGVAKSTNANTTAMSFDLTPGGDFAEVRVKFLWLTGFSEPNQQFRFDNANYPSGTQYLEASVARDNSEIDVYDEGSGFASGTCPVFTGGETAWIALRLDADGTVSTKMWDASGSEPGWQASFASGRSISDFTVFTILNFTPEDPGYEFYEVVYTTGTTGGGGGDDPFFVGARDYSFISDAGEMVNDALVWGTAAGVSTVKFGRSTDTTSISLHDRWQAGEFNESMYKQTSIDTRAHAMVYGNDASQHGAHEDRLACKATIFTPTFFLGDVVTCKAYVYSETSQDPPFEDTEVLTAILPVRRITMTFPTQDRVQFDLLLTQELDEPWSIYEYVFPPIPKPPRITDVPPGLPTVPSDGDPTCTDEICGITDDFQREVAAGADGGIATCGLAYTNFYPAGTSVSGGVLTQSTQVSGASSDNYDLFGIKPTSDIYLTCQMTDSGADSPDDAIFIGADSDKDFAEVDFSTDGTLEFITNGDDQTTTMPFTSRDKFKVRLNADGANARVKVWLATDPEPSGWTLTAAFDVPQNAFDIDIYFGLYEHSSVYSSTATFERLVSPENTRCTLNGMIDDASAPTSSGDWGQALSGGTWATSGTHCVFNRGQYPFFGALSINAANAHGGSPLAFLPYIPSPPISGDQADLYCDLWVNPFLHAAGSATITFFLTVGDDTSTDIAVSMVLTDANTTLINVSYQDRNGDGGGSDQVDLGLHLEGQWLSVHLQLRADGLRAVMWPKGTSEPAFQTVSDTDFTAQMLADLSGIGALQVGYTMSLTYGATSIFDPDEDFYVAVDNIKLVHAGSPCYAGCLPVPFEEFDRTSFPTWGTATAGFTWKYLGPSGTDLQVVPGYGIFLQNDPGTVPNQHGNAYIYDDSRGDIWGGDFELLTSFAVSTLPDAAHSGTLASWALALSEASPYDGSLDQFVLFTKRDAGNGDNDTITLGGVTITSPYSFIAGNIYSLRWTKTGVAHTVTFWPLGTTMPTTPDVTAVVAAIDPAAFVIFQQQPFTRVFTSDPSASLDIDWGVISINSGRCDCPDLTPIDYFVRTEDGPATPTANPATWTNYGGWGTSTHGEGWTPFAARYHAWVDPAIGGIMRVNDDGAGQIDLALTPTTPLDMTFHDIGQVCQVGSVGGRTDIIFTGFGNGLQVSVDHMGVVTAQAGSFNASVDLATDLVATGRKASFRVTSTDGKTDCALYAWLDGDPEPTTPGDSWTGGDGTRTLTKVGVQVFPAGFTTQTIDFSLRSITAGPPCDQTEPVPGVGDPGLPQTGFMCENITHSGGSDFGASRAFAGAPEVYVDGERILIAGFTFNGPAGTIHLATPITGANQLRLCYIANGDPL